MRNLLDTLRRLRRECGRARGGARGGRYGEKRTSGEKLAPEPGLPTEFRTRRALRRQNFSGARFSYVIPYGTRPPAPFSSRSCVFLRPSYDAAPQQPPRRCHHPTPHSFFIGICESCRKPPAKTSRRFTDTDKEGVRERTDSTPIRNCFTPLYEEAAPVGGLLTGLDCCSTVEQVWLIRRR